MGYTPNNPYIPGDPYSYDLKWVVESLNKIKADIIQLEKTYTTPTVIDMASEMRDVNKIYVYVGNEVGYQPNHWYYYDLDTHLWTDGGTYGSITPDSALSPTSTNAVENRVVTTALGTKLDIAAIDSSLDAGSSDPVTNSAIVAALATKLDIAAIDSSLDADSSDPVANSAIVAALATKQNALTLPLSVGNGGTGQTGLISDSSIANCVIYKWGELVSVFMRVVSVDANGKIPTIPSGYRPATYGYYPCMYIASGIYYPAFIYVESNGNNQVYYSNGTNYVVPVGGTLIGTLTYIA